MANMSYCRFQNTLNDFRDCSEAFLEMAYEGDEDLSEDEGYAAKALLVEMAELFEELHINIDADQLDQALKLLKLGKM